MVDILRPPHLSSDRNLDRRVGPTRRLLAPIFAPLGPITCSANATPRRVRYSLIQSTFICPFLLQISCIIERRSFGMTLRHLQSHPQPAQIFLKGLNGRWYSRRTWRTCAYPRENPAERQLKSFPSSSNLVFNHRLTKKDACAPLGMCAFIGLMYTRLPHRF